MSLRISLYLSTHQEKKLSLKEAGDRFCGYLLFKKMKKPSSILPSHNCVKTSSEFTKHNASLCQHEDTVPQLFGRARAPSSTSVHLSQVLQLAPSSGPATMLLWMTIIPGRLCSWSPARDKLEQLEKDNGSSLSAYGGEHPQQTAEWDRELLIWSLRVPKTMTLCS